MLFREEERRRQGGGGLRMPAVQRECTEAGTCLARQSPREELCERRFR